MEIVGAIPDLNSLPGSCNEKVNSMFNAVKAGDVVIIEFGHNEGGGPQGNPQQGVCPGTDLTTTCSEYASVDS